MKKCYNYTWLYREPLIGPGGVVWWKKTIFKNLMLRPFNKNLASKIVSRHKYTWKLQLKKIIWVWESCQISYYSRKNKVIKIIMRNVFCLKKWEPLRILNVMLGFHEHLLFSIFFIKSPPSLLNYVTVASSITMATPLHHHIKLNGTTLR